MIEAATPFSLGGNPFVDLHRDPLKDRKARHPPSASDDVLKLFGVVQRVQLLNVRDILWDELNYVAEPLRLACLQSSHKVVVQTARLLKCLMLGEQEGFER